MRLVNNGVGFTSSKTYSRTCVPYRIANRQTPPCMTIDGIGGLMNVKLHRKEWRYGNDGHDVFTEETEFRKRMREQHQDWTEPLEMGRFCSSL